MLRNLVRRGAPLRTTATVRASPRCLASLDASADSTRLVTRGGGGAGRGFATVDDAKTTERKTLDLSSHQLFGALGLQTFSKDELRAAFDKADLDGAAGSDAAFGAASVLLVGTAARFRYLAPSK